MNTIIKLTGLIGVIILILSGGACHPELDVVGNWRDIDGGEYIQFNQDKSYRAAMTSDFNADSLIETGRFSLQPASLNTRRTMTVILGDGSPSCAGESRRFEVQHPGANRLRLIREDGDCDLRPNTETYELERVR